MHTDAATAWRQEALDHVFAAIAASETLAANLVFKGARVLSARLHDDGRQSLDLDTNLTRTFLDAYPDRDQQGRALEEAIDRALRIYFARQDPVYYSVKQVRVTTKLTKRHPWGWDAFEVGINLADTRHPSVIGIPRLTIDVAAPEALGPCATAPLEVDGHEVIAYTTPRIAGEKLRAFLTSLPAYRAKLGGRGDSVRVRDLFDLARIDRQETVADTPFWRIAAEEFRIACASRYVDCDGLPSFAENVDVTRATYMRDPSLTRISFEEAWGTLQAVVELLERWGVVPFTFPLPPRNQNNRTAEESGQAG